MSFWPGRTTRLAADPRAARLPHGHDQMVLEPVAAPAGRFQPSTADYRPDIDGLRAVAITLVIAYHAVPQLLPGGFIGVDVFFVISGYLITRLILTGLRHGTFSLIGFYQRRVRRIVPALLLVLSVCFALGWFTLLPGEFAWFGRSILWSAPFLANAFFAHVTGYFDPGADYNLLLHLWSLGVEDQFYLLWPLLLILAVRYRATTSTLWAVIATSLAISVWGTRNAPLVHFYLPGPRAWELAVGAILAARQFDTRPAVFAGPRSRRYDARWLLALAGLALIGGGALLLSADNLFPGAWGVIPAGGAALLIGAGPDSPLNRGLLAARPLVLIGRLSYSLYLWHYPMFAFSRVLWGPVLQPAAVGGVIVLALAAAYATWRWVEVPLRRGAGGRWAVAALLGGLVGFTAIGAAMNDQQLPGRLSGPAFSAWELARDWQVPAGSRSDPGGRIEIPALRGGRGATTLFIGDSHMQQYWPRISQLIAEHPDRARSVLFATYAGCPILPGLNNLWEPRSCDAFFTAATQRALDPHVDTVVFGAFWEAYLLGEYTVGEWPGVYRAGNPWRTRVRLDSRDAQIALMQFEQLLERLVASGRRVFIILSNPTSPQFDPRWLVPSWVRLSPHVPSTFTADPSRCVDVAAFEAFAAPVTDRLREIAQRSGAKVLDPRSTLCDGMSCPAVGRNGMPLYLDSNHLGAAYARERASFLDPTVLASESR